MYTFHFNNLNKSALMNPSMECIEEKNIVGKLLHNVSIYLNGDHIGNEDEAVPKSIEYKVRNYLRKCGFSNFKIQKSQIDDGIDIITTNKEDAKYMRTNLKIFLNYR